MSYVLVRPKINWKKTILCIGVALAIAITIGVSVGQVTDFLGISEDVHRKLVFVCYLCMCKISSLEARVIIVVVLLEMFIFRKKVAIWLVRCYQRYAPESLRSECLFEPCCSNYMILSIEKYGFFKGISKGIKRIRRCHQPNGGIDYP